MDLFNADTARSATRLAITMKDDAEIHRVRDEIKRFALMGLYSVKIEPTVGTTAVKHFEAIGFTVTFDIYDEENVEQVFSWRT